MDMGTPFDLLDVQYRMHPDISIFPNNSFYGGILKDANSVKNSEDTYSYPLHYAFINYEGIETNSNGQIYNSMEADFVVHMLIRLATKGVDMKTVRVITFYAAQVGYLQRELRRMRLFDVTVATVDSFQGTEADIIILSTVRSGSRVGFLKDFQRLNVALTRAKHMLLVIADAQTLLQSQDYVLCSLVQDAKTRDVYYEGESIERLLYWIENQYNRPIPADVNEKRPLYQYLRSNDKGNAVAVRTSRFSDAPSLPAERKPVVRLDIRDRIPVRNDARPSYRGFDSRPKTLSITNAPPDFVSQAADHFSRYGEVLGVTTSHNGAVLVEFSKCIEAELAKASGAFFLNDILTISWS
jgi:hypothetical protein